MFQVILSKTLIRPSKHSVGSLHRSYHPLFENQWCKMEPGFTTGKTKPIFYIHICACAEVRIYCWHDLLKVGKSNFPYLYCYLYHEYAKVKMFWQWVGGDNVNSVTKINCRLWNKRRLIPISQSFVNGHWCKDERWIRQIGLITKIPTWNTVLKTL